MDPLMFEEDTFSLTIGLLIRDMHFLSEQHRRAREKTLPANTAATLTRLGATSWLLVLTFGIQLYLLYNVKHLVSAKAVHDMRILYDQYEIHMYGNNVSRMDVTPNGKHRGRPEYFEPSSFDTLPELVKDRACCIPLSQPAFFFAILFMWSVTCVGELMNIWRCFYCLLVQTQTVQDMADCGFGSDAPVENEAENLYLRDIHDGLLMIRGVTWRLKLIVAVCFFIPRVCFTLYILWLGCRYLCATADFAALILNALAFKFILNLKDIIYWGLAPARTRVHLKSLRMLPERYSVAPNHSHLRHVVLMTIIVAIWVWIYTKELQAVIPDYRWDVHNVCVDYLLIRYAV